MPLKLPLKGFAKDPQKIKSEVTGPSVGKVGRANDLGSTFKDVSKDVLDC